MNTKVLDKFKDIQNQLNKAIQDMEKDSEYIPSLVVECAQERDLCSIIKYTSIIESLGLDTTSDSVGIEHIEDIWSSPVPISDDEVDLRLKGLVQDFMTQDSYTHRTKYLQRVTNYIMDHRLYNSPYVNNSKNEDNDQ